MAAPTRRTALAGLVATAAGQGWAAETADFAPPAVGTSWTYLRNGVEEAGRRVRDREHGGRRLLAYERDEGGVLYADLFLPLSGAWVVTLDARGRPLSGATPNNFALDWPLAVGRRWRAEFTFEDFEAGTRMPVTVAWSVRVARDFDTPFGRVRAFGLRGASPGVLRGNWFAPALGIYYRQTVEEEGRLTFDRTLVAYRPA